MTKEAQAQVTDLTNVVDRSIKGQVIDKDVIQNAAETVLNDIGKGKEIMDMFKYFRGICYILQKNQFKVQAKESARLESNIRVVNGIEIDITENIPDKSFKGRKDKIKLIKAIVSSEIHSNNLLKLFDLKFIEMLSQKEISEKLRVTRQTVASQEKQLIRLLKGIDILRDLLTSPKFPIYNIPSKQTGSKSLYKIVTVKMKNGKEIQVKAALAAEVDFLATFQVKRIERERASHIDPVLKPFTRDHKHWIAPYKELTGQEIRDNKVLSKAIMQYNRIECCQSVNKPTEVVKVLPYYLSQFKDLCDNAPCIEELHLLHKEHTLWTNRHPRA